MTADHDRHSHGQVGGGHGSNSRRIFWTLLLTGSFMLVEVVGGVISGSLALLADAAHMLVDTVSLLLAWIAFWLSRRPADKGHTYGFHRFPVLAAFTNGITLIFIIGWIFIEAVGRLFNPAEVLAGPMLVVAGVGLVVNLFAFMLLHGADRNNLNIRGALLHVLGDMLGSAAAVVAALIIMINRMVCRLIPLLSVSGRVCWCCAAPGFCSKIRHMYCWKEFPNNWMFAKSAGTWFRIFRSLKMCIMYTHGLCHKNIPC